MFPDVTRQRGMGLPFAIFVIVILSMVGLAITALERSSAESVALEVQSARAFMAAQSGMELGLNRLMPPGGATANCSHGFFAASPSITFTTAALEGCAATVTCDADVAGGETYYRLTSAASCGTGPDDASRTIETGIRF